MNTKEYKDHILNEYNRLFENPEEKEPNIHIVMWGDEGLEGYKMAHEPKDLDVLFPMEMRCRFNTHRNIGIYAFTADFVIPADDINEELLKNTKKVMRLF